MKVYIAGAGVGAANYLPHKKLNKYPPAFVVEWKENKRLLFECSVGVYWRLDELGIDYSKIHHVAISHPHPDHCAPIHFLQAVFLKGLWGGDEFKNPELTFYGPDYLIDNFYNLNNIYNPNQEGILHEWPIIKLEKMSQGNNVQNIYNATLQARKVLHGSGKCDAVSYRLETPEGVIAYSGDSGDCEGIRSMAENADLFICEASARIGDFESPKNYGHLNPYTIGEIAKAVNVKKLLLFHYTGLDSDEDIVLDIKKSSFTGEIICGKDGQVLTV